MVFQQDPITRYVDLDEKNTTIDQFIDDVTRICPENIKLGYIQFHFKDIVHATYPVVSDGKYSITIYLTDDTRLYLYSASENFLRLIRWRLEIK